MSEKLVDLTRIRAREPERIGQALRSRRRRPLLNERGTLFLVAADVAKIDPPIKAGGSRTSFTCQIR